jgi:hypothetical protein
MRRALAVLRLAREVHEHRLRVVGQVHVGRDRGAVLHLRHG